MRVGQRSFLFLQGLATPFFARLAGEMIARGHDAHHINICAGDRLFWPLGRSTDFRGREEGWPGFLAEAIRERGVTDLLLFGDCRPYHEAAIAVAKRLGVAIHVFEEGYFRPNWITIERDGTNALSSLPREPEEILAADPRVEQEFETAGGGFVRRVWWECLSQVATIALKPLYAGYRRHRPYHPATEVAGWIGRLAKRPWERGYSNRLTAYLAGCQGDFYLFPLQIQSDYQIRRHSPFRDLKQAQELVLRSFAKHAPADTKLVIKVHPLDNGLNNHRRHVLKMVRSLKLRGRVYVIDGGHLPTLLDACSGVVVVNSTSGLSAIHHERPVKVLGSAIFNLRGLTFQGSLDDFWTKGEAPDQKLYKAFRRTVLERTQVNGSYFSKKGMPLAIQGVLERLSVTQLETQSAESRIPNRPDARIGAVPKVAG